MNPYDDHARFTDSLFDENLQDEMLEFESEIDFLFNAIKEYRKSKKFRDIIEFCNRFNHIAPFNAMLINMQRPGSRLALTAKDWAQKYDRGLKPNAQPLIYLNHTPVGAMYDISDTVAVDGFGMTDQEIIEDVAHPFKGSGDFDAELLKNLVANLEYNGIAHDFGYNAAESLAAYIAARQVLHKVVFNRYGVKGEFNWPMPYLVSINKEADDLQRMQSLCHELGHFFCHHLPPASPDWWVKRRHDIAIREFEAEITAYMVCKRNGIPCPRSEEYLAHYVEVNEEIPRNLSVETIMKAVSSIERMMKPMSWSEGLLYKNDSLFKKRLQEERDKVDRKGGKA
ncbi:MAG: ImmA/IrrE family metallo-endopeptidase [Bacteroidales bacterium]|nr:ImmA/IrrE family metallo-endopeptidase [Bacteroidales bacterium]